jgi:hypothetical protein
MPEDPWGDIASDFPPESYDDLFPVDDNRSGRSSIDRGRRGVEPTTTTISDSQWPDFSGVMKPVMLDGQVAPGLRAGISDEARGSIAREAQAGPTRAGLEARSFSLPDWGTDVSFAGMETNKRARDLIEDEYQQGLKDIEAGAAARRRMERGPAYAEAQVAEQLGKARTAQLGAAKAEYEFAERPRLEQEKRQAWDDYAKQVAGLDQRLSAYLRSGGQTPGGKGEGMDERGYTMAKQQAWRELLAKLQTITGKPYGGLASDPRMDPMAQFQYGDPMAQYGAAAPMAAAPERIPESQ